MQEISRYLQRNVNIFNEIPIQSLMEALDFLMRNNIFTFSNTTWLLFSGTTMGTLPVPTYATIYYAIYKK